MGWLDVLFGALLAGFGIFLVVMLILGGGTVIQVGLVAGVFVLFTARWMSSSWGWETLRRRK